MASLPYEFERKSGEQTMDEVGHFESDAASRGKAASLRHMNVTVIRHVTSTNARQLTTLRPLHAHGQRPPFKDMKHHNLSKWAAQILT
jgi:hypothetical protein